MIAVLFIPVSIVASAGVASAAPDNICNIQMQDPHFSTGEQGYIAKADWTCSLLPTVISLETFGYILYRCNNNPPKSQEVVHEECAIVGSNNNDITLTQKDPVDTRYVPSAKGGAQGAGWYIAIATWQDRGPAGTGSIRTSYSNAVYLK